ncbi:holin [Mycobacterium phage SemperFi]|uniref:Holin n=1 Tax=Mycobacterium phage Georgie2 TaxID=2743928 RepID=A0A7D5JK40_9CAUD|nr:holin [Mycobacterium phage SweetiePie]YP_010063817.1 holin [Mycobacterium phage Georgie2]AIS73773.1 holin [Mycobacterium phage Power]ATN91855.1 holin [Mycobacterium phage SnapTap]AXC33262.1 holin [Mycobacterium phage Crucio]AXQ52936.1 holin [Mycobacterium phage QueenBeesly]QFG11812.1 holin [Mycobacterium phage SemperFi]QKY80075.1 holin [Mycobacterium Phage FiringLine]
MSPKFRQTLYYLGTIVPGVLGIALIWGGIDAGAAQNLGDIIAGALNLIGATAPATAAVKVNQQRKDGTLTSSAVDQVINGVQAVIEKQQSAQAELDKVKDAVTGVINVIPGLDPLVQQAINAVNTWQPPTAYSQVADLNRQPWNR